MTIVSSVLKDKGASVISVTPAQTLGEAAKLLADNRIGATLVMEGGKIAGILSERDIVRALAAMGTQVLSAPVSSAMTSHVFTCSPKDEIVSIMGLMTQRRIRHVPVVEADRLVGVISIGDVVKFRLAEIESEAQALKEYIATG